MRPVYLSSIFLAAFIIVLTYFLHHTSIQVQPSFKSLQHQNITIEGFSLNRTIDREIRGAAFMLVSKNWRSNRGRKCFFNRSVTALEKYWLPSNSYPLVLGRQDGVWEQWEMSEIINMVPKLHLRFENCASAFMIEEPLLLEDNHKLSDVNYKRMIRFKLYSFLELPFIHDLDYLFFLDDDACVAEMIEFDVFERMKKRHVAYALKQLFHDPAFVVQGLWDFVEAYMNRRGIEYANKPLYAEIKQQQESTVSTTQEAKDFWAFSANFDWIDLNAYRDRKILNFFDTLESSQMIFHRRWGDSPLRFALSFMFWNRDQAMKICTPYQHSTWLLSARNCDEPFNHDAILESLKNCTAGYCN